jgi:signal transduction histidine kinase/CheY-like chemotaxis protein
VAVEALFALVFVGALGRYLRRPDALQGAVVLTLSSMSAVFVLDLVRTFTADHTAPVALSLPAGCWLYAQPLLMTRAIVRMRSVRADLVWLATGVYLITVVLLLVHLPGYARYQPLPVASSVAVRAGLLAMDVMTAWLIWTLARSRTGSSRVRLSAAALSTVVYALAIVIRGFDRRGGIGEISGYQVFSEALALAAALGYLVAFVPPRWVQRTLSGSAAYAVTQSLLEVPAGADAAEVWRRYLEAVRDVVGAESAVVLHAAGDSMVELAALGMAAEPAGQAWTAEDLDRTLALAQPVTSRSARSTPLARAIAARCQCGRYLWIRRLHAPAGTTAALVFRTTHRALFAEDDLRLIAGLGGPAGILAGRAAARADRARLTDELAATVDALRTASAAKSDFVASMSHELRTPLNAIIGFSDLMSAEELVDGGRAVPAEWIDHVLSGGRHLLDLINDILDIAKVESGQMELHPRRIDLAPFCADVVEALRPVAASKGVELRTAASSTTVAADPLRLRQILDNLMANAIKFTPGGGRVTLSAEQVVDEVHLAVQDTGVGIAAEDQERVFEEFQQVGDVAARQGGTGLGLALTRRLVAAHGGRVELYSELGKGSRFTVCLPQRASLVPLPDRRAPAAARRRGDVLVIEDDPASAQLLRTYLENAHYQVRTFGSGEEGLATALGAPPDAILLDLLLPGINGWEVLRQLRRDEVLQEIPVFVVTILDDEVTRVSSGATDYFVKPVDRSRLLARLAEHVLAGTRDGVSIRILAIDDDPATLEVIRASLADQGVEVCTASSAREGLTMLAGPKEFDLIITDLVMPEMDGFSLIAAINQEPHAADIPILVLTGSDLSTADHARLGDTVVGVILKGGGACDELRGWLSQVTPDIRHMIRSMPSPDGRPPL